MNGHDEMDHPRGSLAVSGDGQGSTVSDDGNPTPTSGHDDGYHTEGEYLSSLIYSTNWTTYNAVCVFL